MKRRTLTKSLNQLWSKTFARFRESSLALLLCNLTNACHFNAEWDITQCYSPFMNISSPHKTKQKWHNLSQRRRFSLTKERSSMHLDIKGLQDQIWCIVQSILYESMAFDKFKISKAVVSIKSQIQILLIHSLSACSTLAWLYVLHLTSSPCVLFLGIREYFYIWVYPCVCTQGRWDGAWSGLSVKGRVGRCDGREVGGLSALIQCVTLWAADRLRPLQQGGFGQMVHVCVCMCLCVHMDARLGW